jgi:membrane-bound lytic murein transglycosylase D
LLFPSILLASDETSSDTPVEISGFSQPLEYPENIPSGTFDPLMANEFEPLGLALETEELVQPIYIPQALDLTEPTDDLWARIRNGFAMPNLNDDLVSHYQQYYLAHPDYLHRMVARSRLYLHHIVEELETRNMPMELALLPMVESAYNPMAYSSSQASGLWQFIPSTGKYYNLQQNWWHDQRRDIIASTSAALDYLQYIYEMHGDWHLTLASYNWGEGAVGRAIAKNKAKGLPTSYTDLAMPNETRHYVPKLQALKNIFISAEQTAALELPPVPNQPYFQTFVTQTPIDIKLAAQFAELGVEEFVALNPAHNRPVIQAGSTLIIPADRMEQFMAGLAAHEAPLSTWDTYILKRGEKLENIAPRFGISLANLKRVNGLHDRAKVNSGQTLLVPIQGGSNTSDLTFLPAFTNPARGASTRSYTVRKGDTLFTIAHRHDMNINDLKTLNRLKKNTITPGMRLTVSAPVARQEERAAPIQSTALTPQTSRPEKPVTRTNSATAKETPSAKTTRHTVQKGDTLFSIAKRYNVTLADLKRWNKLASNLLKIGMILHIPTS